MFNERYLTSAAESGEMMLAFTFRMAGLGPLWLRSPGRDIGAQCPLHKTLVLQAKKGTMREGPTLIISLLRDDRSQLSIYYYSYTAMP